MTRLPNLPDPEAILPLSYEETLDQKVVSLVEQFDLANVVYDVGNLETDPAKIQAEVAAYRELLIRAQINESVKANLFAFAQGGNLDQLAVSVGVTRLAGETDIQLFKRCLLAIASRSGAGPKALYELLAMSSDVDVKSAYCYRPGRGPKLHVAVVSHSNGGQASVELLQIVQAAISDETVRVFSDVLTAVPAAPVLTDLSADIWLLPETPMAVFDNLEASLRNNWLERADFNLDLTISWIIGQLQAVGVHRVDILLPVSNVIASPEQIIALGAITLTYKGRDK